mgnify:CR=1 FL=1
MNCRKCFFQVEESVCTKCDHMERCWGEDYVHTYQLGYEVLHAIEEYGKELNLETKRKLQKKMCDGAKVPERAHRGIS